MEIEGGPVQPLSGMAVTVEIETGSRRIISYLLSPLVRSGRKFCEKDRNTPMEPAPTACWRSPQSECTNRNVCGESGVRVQHEIHG
jgi:hypothetical protein